MLLVILNSDVSVNGQKEVNIFQEYCPIDRNEVELYSHLIYLISDLAIYYKWKHKQQWLLMNIYQKDLLLNDII